MLLSATDVANHLSCVHLTALSLQVARGEIEAPAWEDPHLAVLQLRGMEHERAYLSSLRERGLAVLDLTNQPPQDTLNAMRQGVPAIYQGTLGAGQWGGRTDVLLRVERPSGFGAWSYEVVDCKLASETKAETAMQLCLYSELLEGLQGVQPEFFHVIRPNVDFQPESYRTAAYAAYFRQVKQSLQQAVAADTRDTYPEPVEHCEMCRWWKRCDTQRRRDDHLSFVAGVSRLQRKELTKHEVGTLRQLAALPLPVPFAPDRGSREGYVRIREQARVQFEAREESRMKFERLDLEAGKGLYRLPAPSAGDIFLDFEGDPFVDGGGLEYLTGIQTAEGYQGRWAVDREQERSAFEWLIDLAMERWLRYPDLHIYHFGAYEPGAVKRLMLRYATREEEVDRLLRGEKFVDLHAIVKQSVRASVEQYSLKDVERLFGFERQVPLADASQARHFVEHQLELGSPQALGERVKAIVERYNDDDCRSTEGLRAWLEEVRSSLDIPRPVPKDTAPSEEVSEAQRKVAEVFAALTHDLPAEPSERNAEQAARWLLAHALDWHRREDKVKGWEFFRLKGLVEEDLYEEKQGLAGLSYLQRLPKSKPRERSPIDRYSYPPQECSIRAEDPLYTLDGERFGEVHAIDTDARTIDVKKPVRLDSTHPPACFAHRHVDSKELSNAVLRLAQWIVANGMDAEGEYRAARDLLLRKAPRAEGGVLPIQGPPGSGKTYRGARMIADWIGQEKSVGVTAVGHKVIDKLLCEVLDATASAARCGHKGEDDGGAIRMAASNEEALELLQSGKVDVMGGTAWMWARPDFAAKLDVLVVDEAGQMSLANVLACAGAARSLVLLGDPQQLEQPQQGSHPEGSDISALAHLLGGAKTISVEQGLFLGQTWRLHPDLCAYTSEMFYEGRLTSVDGLHRQRIDAGDFLSGAGLWWAPVAHEGNQSHSDEEIEVVAWMLEQLTQTGATWVNRTGERKPLTQDDVLIVAPYNDQVSRLKDRLPGAKVGTVDKFQGQEAAVVLYSMTSSSPEDAPRGMEFLYNLNRFNVATSRARCACIVIGSPKLFAPGCRTPRQIELANALCRYAELSGRLRVVERVAGV
ncbi:MAG: TM0106 family RecB-like putative nuclease [Bryobacteraceae bacterium]